MFLRPRFLLRASKVACWVVCLVLCGLGWGRMQAQQPDSLRFRAPGGRPADTLQLPAGNLVPFSERVSMGGATLQRDVDYQIDYFRGVVHFSEKVFRALPADISYRVFPAGSTGPGPLRLRQMPVFAQESASGPVQDTSTYQLLGPTRTDSRSTTPFFSASRIQRSGSISRAVTVGSNRDLGVTSDFRLQLNGTVGDDIEIAAAMTDENIPIQPSGATQQLSDFDRIFIRLKKDRQTVTFGDMQLAQRGTRFADLYRNVQGISIERKGDRSQWMVSGSASKGRFATNSFQGQNGRQGPYRLRGSENEPFIIVLAGSEKVYLNGRLLVRGENRDYVIDYNTGELTFTPANLIEVNTRIVVDFEYAVQNFSRSLLFGTYAGRYFNDRLALTASYAREADDPDAPVNLQLSANDLAQLRNIRGDQTSGTIAGGDSVGFVSGEIRYEKRDTLVGAVTYPGVFVRSVNPQRAVYRVSFALVGPNRGDYVRDSALVNGAVFRWVPPVAGVPQGDYAPQRTVPLPREIQVGAVGMEWRFSNRLRLFSQNAFSRDNRNRFADNGLATRRGFANRTGLRADSLKLSNALQLSAEVAAQYVDASFQNVDRVYVREYGREWNINDLGTRGTERLVEGFVQLTAQNRYSLKIGGGYRAQDDSLRTQRLYAEFQSTDSSRLAGANLLQYIRTNNVMRGTTSSWVRNNGDLFHRFGASEMPIGRLGAEIWMENRREETVPGERAQGSFDFVDLKPYFRGGEGRKLSYDVGMTWRYDRAFLLGSYREKSRSWKPYAMLAWRPREGLTLSTQTTYYRYDLLDNAFVQEGLGPERTLLSNLQAAYSAPSRSWQGSAIYEVSTEQVARREVLYIKVTPGLGQYDWIDYNGNGIEELNEFEPTVNPLLANYIRLLAPTPTLIPAIRLSLGATLRFDFAQWAEGGTGWVARVLRQTTTQSSFRLEQRRRDPTDQFGSYLISFDTPERADSSLLSQTLQVRQDVFLFRNNPKGDLSFSWLATRALNLLAVGSDLRATQTFNARQRYNLNERYGLENLFQFGKRRSLNESLPGRVYAISFVGVNPSVGYQLSRKARLSFGYDFRYKELRASPAETNADLRSHKLIFEGRWNYKGRNTLTARLELLQNDMLGQPAASARFELLEGLQPGRNGLWNLLWVQYLSSLLELNVVYDGRAASGVPVIHSTRVQLKAYF